MLPQAELHRGLGQDEEEVGFGSGRRIVSAGAKKTEIFCSGCRCSWFGGVIEGERSVVIKSDPDPTAGGDYESEKCLKVSQCSDKSHRLLIKSHQTVVS